MARFVQACRRRNWPIECEALVSGAVMSSLAAGRGAARLLAGGGQQPTRGLGAVSAPGAAPPFRSVQHLDDVAAVVTRDPVRHETVGQAMVALAVATPVRRKGSIQVVETVGPDDGLKFFALPPKLVHLAQFRPLSADFPFRRKRRSLPRGNHIPGNRTSHAANGAWGLSPAAG